VGGFGRRRWPECPIAQTRPDSFPERKGWAAQRHTPNKLEFKKYDPVVRKHVMYKEAKIK